MKSDHTPRQAILDLVQSMRDIEQRAAQHYRPLLDDILRTGNRDVRDDIVPWVAADKAFRNARDHTPHTVRMAHDQALAAAAQILLQDDTLIYKQFVENDTFRRSVGDRVYQITRDSPRPGHP